MFVSGGQKPLLLSSLKASFPSDDNETADLTAGIYLMVLRFAEKNVQKVKKVESLHNQLNNNLEEFHIIRSELGVL